MEKLEPTQELYSLSLLKEAISSSPKKIEQELSKGGNDWLACFATRVQVISAFLSIAEERGEITKDEYEEYKNKIRDIKDQLKGSISAYRETNTGPSEEEKQKLIASLDILS